MQLTNEFVKELAEVGREAGSKARQELCDQINGGGYKGPFYFTLVGDLAAARAIASKATEGELQFIAELLAIPAVADNSAALNLCCERAHKLKGEQS